MSLKAFHVFFVAISLLLCLYLGVWAWAAMARGEAAGMAQVLLGVAILGVVAMGAYGRWMLKKFAGESYL